MCNLNIFVKTPFPEGIDSSIKSIETAKLFSFMTGVTNTSYKFNDEGDGIYFSTGVFKKTLNKIKYEKFMKDIRDSNFIITHQRIATSGKTSAYTQPFNNKNFVLAHNGIMNEFAEGTHSDTYVFFQTFLKNFKLAKGKTRTRRIVSSIKKIFDKKSLGYYSIVLYDKVEKNMYYFKNSYSRITFYRDVAKSMLYISTETNNNIFLNIFNEVFKEFDIETNIIYKIVCDDKIRIFPVGKIKEAEVKSAWEPVNNYDATKGLPSNNKDISKMFESIDEENNEDLIDIKKICGTYSTKEPGYCVDCGEDTNNYERKTALRVCDDCYLKPNDTTCNTLDDIDEYKEYVEDYLSSQEQLNTDGGGKNGV